MATKNIKPIYIPHYLQGIANDKDLDLGTGHFLSDTFRMSTTEDGDIDDYEEARIKSTLGVRLLLEADSDNANEYHVPRIVMSQDGGGNLTVLGQIGNASALTDPDGIELIGAAANDFVIHKVDDENILLAIAHKVLFELSTSGQGELQLLGSGSYDEGFFIRFGDSDMGICEFLDDDLRIQAYNSMEIASRGGVIKLGYKYYANDTEAMSNPCVEINTDTNEMICNYPITLTSGIVHEITNAVGSVVLTTFQRIVHQSGSGSTITPWTPTDGDNLRITNVSTGTVTFIGTVSGVVDPILQPYDTYDMIYNSTLTEWIK